MSRTRSVGGVLTAAAAGALLFTGCAAANPPCETLDPPTAEMVTSTTQGAEVEIEIEGQWGKAECVAVVTGPGTGRWQDQTDDA